MATRTAYETLLLDYQPRPIRSRAAYVRALRQVEQLMSKPYLGRAESEMVELLATLIEQYEAIEHPTPPSTPAEMVQHFLEVRNLTKGTSVTGQALPQDIQGIVEEGGVMAKLRKEGFVT